MYDNDSFEELKNFETELPSGYRQAAYINAKDKKFGIIFNVIAVAVLAVVMVAAVFSLKLSDRLYFGDFQESITELFIAYVILMVSMIGYIVLHELVHGIAYKALTGEKLTFGISWSCAFCGVPNIFTYRKTAMISVAAPFTVFSIMFIPILIVLFFTNTIYYLVAAFIFGLHLGGCSGDLYVLYLLTFKYTSEKILMRDTGPEQFFYVPEDKQ